jgi:cytochrome P450
MPGLISDNGFLGASGWNDYWRRARRFTQSMLSTSIIQQSIPKQTTEARQMVVDLLKDPSRYTYWLERAGVMVSMKQIYGLSEERGLAEKEHVHEICGFMENIERVAVPGVYLVEFIPWLVHLPMWLAPFKREAKQLVKRHWDYLAPLVQKQSDRYATKQPEQPESFSRRFLKSKQDWNLTDREIVWTLASIYGGAAGTSSTAMQSLILNMCLFPEWQERVQEEIEQVVGDDRLPDFNDSNRMPTIRAVIKETMRWRPVLSGGS